MTFQDNVVFITGASSGIGEALAREAAAQGARVALTARREERLQALKTELEGQGAKVMAHVCDVTNRADIDRAVDQTVQAFGGIDMTIANAGFGLNGLFANLDTDAFRRQFDTNVFGLIDTIYATLPHLEASQGQLGLVSSVLGRFAMPAMSAYCASKFAVCGLAEGLCYELRERGVSVTCINPGVVESEFRQRDQTGAINPELEDPAPAWIRVPTDKAARAMLRALAARRPEAVITGHGKLLTAAARHFPRTFRALTALATRGRLDLIEQKKRHNG